MYAKVQLQSFLFSFAPRSPLAWTTISCSSFWHVQADPPGPSNIGRLISKTPLSLWWRWSKTSPSAEAPMYESLGKSVSPVDWHCRSLLPNAHILCTYANLAVASFSLPHFDGAGKPIMGVYPMILCWMLTGLRMISPNIQLVILPLYRSCHSLQSLCPWVICSIKSDSVVSITCSCSSSLQSSFIYFDLVSVPSNSMADCVKVVSLPYQMISFRINCSIHSYTCVYVLSGGVSMYMSSRVVWNVDVTVTSNIANYFDHIQHDGITKAAACCGFLSSFHLNPLCT